MELRLDLTHLKHEQCVGFGFIFTGCISLVSDSGLVRNRGGKKRNACYVVVVGRTVLLECAFLTVQWCILHPDAPVKVGTKD